MWLWVDVVWDIGIEFGIVGVGKSDYCMEIIIFCVDSYDWVLCYLEVCFGDCFEGDLVCCDFIMNVMVVCVIVIGLGEFLDLFGGLVVLWVKVLDILVVLLGFFGDDLLWMLCVVWFVL